MPLHGSHKFGYRTFFNKEQPKLSEKKKIGLSWENAATWSLAAPLKPSG